MVRFVPESRSGLDEIFMNFEMENYYYLFKIIFIENWKTSICVTTNYTKNEILGCYVFWKPVENHIINLKSPDLKLHHWNFAQNSVTWPFDDTTCTQSAYA